MPISRRWLATISASALAAAAVPVRAAEADEASVAKAAETYRKGMLTGDKAALDALCSDAMTYGHSSARVQTKAEFLADVASGKTTWKFINLNDLTHRVAGSNAWSRCVFDGENESGGKTNATKFGLLLVWQRQGEDWKLLARQGYKI